MSVIGLVGPFASGCSTIAKKIHQIRNDYEILSLSDELRTLFKKEYPNQEPTREKLQDFGDEVRQKNKSNYLATLVCKKMKKGKNYVIDSIRNPEEIEFLRKKYADFYLFGIFSDREKRWERVRENYNLNEELFKNDDERDQGEEFDYGQRVTDSFKTSDIIILNNGIIMDGNDYDRELNAKIENNINLIEKKIPFIPSATETNMAVAYAVSMRSSCLKRKVGAAIAGENGNIFSTGYNEVPALNKPCKQNYGTCYRDYLKQNFKNDLEKEVPNDKDIVYNLFKKQFKILDNCKALHAEENAILNVTKTGSSFQLKKSVLYTSTYPCSLCANKIAQVGISRVVFFEPYPMAQAKETLTKGGIIQEHFEGVTYNGYFRLMEVIY